MTSQTVTVSDLIAELEQYDGDLSVMLEIGDMLYAVDVYAVYQERYLTLIAGEGVPASHLSLERGLPS